MHWLLKSVVRLILYFTITLRLTIAVTNYNGVGVGVPTIKVIDSEVNVIPTSTEWKTIFGTDRIPEVFSTVSVHYGKLHDVGLNEAMEKHLTIAISIRKLQKYLQLELRPNKHIIDPHFIALVRKTNHSRVIMDTDSVLSLSCYYNSPKPNSAALDICDGLRGILFVDMNHVYFIHPLPAHYNTDKTTLAHVLVKKPLISDSNLETSFISDRINYKSRRRRRHAHWNKANEPLMCGNTYINRSTEAANDGARFKRGATTSAPTITAASSEIYVETAVFVDKDLYNHMMTTFPLNTEKELIRFVLTLINAVHLLYHDPSLGWVINFVLKRLEILHTDPAGLYRVHDIDKFLSSFCTWQNSENPSSDEDPLHWDHAVILTGLDLYVVSKNGKTSNQVVGLAPVAGMCTATSSCTVNEGRHFESAYVVAHEIGHNLGMRHDGPTADNKCDSSGFLMSPTLGSGKITWSTCSKEYLRTFLESKQSRCLFDKTTTSNLLDHSANGILPGERFNANQQCKLKYGTDSHHSASQPLEEICKELQCSRDNYIWTSHPALEGTICGNNKWCRSGRCIETGLTVLEAGYAPHQIVNGGWSEWSSYSECASSCLHDDNGTLSAGSIGIMVASRRCNNPRPENGGEMCAGNDQKYKTCTANQCHKVVKITVTEFSNNICKRASEVDTELTGIGQQRASLDHEEACKVWCDIKGSGFKSRGWTYPDGTVCHLRRLKKSTYCIRGVCKEFTCTKSSSDVIHAHAEEYCDHKNLSRDKRRENAVSHWTPVSECFYNCITPGIGMRLVEKKLCPSCNATMNVQTCLHTQKCNSLKTINEHATTVCNKFSQRVRRLSGLGTQLPSTVEDPHRPCRLACQDERVSRRFYLVNGEEGWFPFGTDCTRGDASHKAFCVNGMCLEFGPGNLPTRIIEHSLPAGRIK